MAPWPNDELCFCPGPPTSIWFEASRSTVFITAEPLRPWLYHTPRPLPRGGRRVPKKNRCFDAGLVSFSAAWPTTIRLWYCCEKHFHSLDRSAVIGLITALAAARLGLWSANHDLRLGYEPIINLWKFFHLVMHSARVNCYSVLPKLLDKFRLFFFSGRGRNVIFLYCFYGFPCWTVCQCLLLLFCCGCCSCFCCYCHHSRHFRVWLSTVAHL